MILDLIKSVKGIIPNSLDVEVHQMNNESEVEYLFDFQAFSMQLTHGITISILGFEGEDYNDVKSVGCGNLEDSEGNAMCYLNFELSYKPNEDEQLFIAKLANFLKAMELINV